MVITMYNDTIKLISETYEQDNLLQFIPKRTEKTVFCEVQSISKSEWYDAGRAGLKAQLKAVMPRINYSEEKIVEYNGKLYGIYRTYLPIGSTIELYLEEKAGVQNVQN